MAFVNTSLSQHSETAAATGEACYVPLEEQAEEDKAWMRVALEQVSEILQLLPRRPVLTGQWGPSHRHRTLTINNQAEDALQAAEVPVGCVFVRNGEAIAKARNQTNEWRNVSLLTS